MISVFLCLVANTVTAPRPLNVTVMMAGEEENVIFVSIFQHIFIIFLSKYNCIKLKFSYFLSSCLHGL